ncbi:MAG: Mur ligase family protein [Hyphomicrobiaceae bacterium]|nr:Mur ligase family protein [Hyphomicrobiaceae bacterium]
MSQRKHYFFCGIGGSGMFPLAILADALGHEVSGSDRALDQGRTAEKFQWLREKGIPLFPQDGSGLTQSDQVLVASAAVEDTVPDVVAANRLGARRMTRAELLAEMFNAAQNTVAVGGTSGKSTTTGMLGSILHQAGLQPTIFNGAIMKDFSTPGNPFASAVAGGPEVFVSEVDESDGSIALFHPRVAVLNNIALDHKSMEELRGLFRAFVAGAEAAVINMDNTESAALAGELPREKVVTFAIDSTGVDLAATGLSPQPDGIVFKVCAADTGESATVKLGVPGRHNVENALAALAAARALGVPLGAAARHLETFTGVGRRLDVVGTAGEVTVIDDFAHNPDKIAATLATLHEFPGRLLIMFQPHGYGPLRLMGDALVECFTRNLAPEDVLVMPEPVYFGGTVERSASSAELVAKVRAAGKKAHAFDDRETCGRRLLELTKPGDRVVIMGARDDSLSEFAAGLLNELSC